MNLINVRFNNSVKCGRTQELFFTDALHALSVKDGLVLVDDHQGNITAVPLSNVGWMTVKPATPTRKAAEK